MGELDEFEGIVAAMGGSGNVAFLASVNRALVGEVDRLRGRLTAAGLSF